MSKRSLSRGSDRKSSHGGWFCESLLELLLCVMPICLFLSYYPVISFGTSETMNFELSVALLWLVVFDVVGLVVSVQRRQLFGWIKSRRWVWLLFPAWLSLSVIWSLNPVRGVLTVGVLWLIYFAGYVIWNMRKLFDERFKRKWLKWLLISSLVICAWCMVQCVLDLVGVSPDYSLMCAGCTYRMFGFPHPNGFAIEPQFMGNLLIAPAMLVAWLYISLGCSRGSRMKQTNKNSKLEPSRGVVFTTAKSDSAPYCSTGSSSVAVVKTTTGSGFLGFKFLLVCFFVIAATLFLTFSRGAIYAFVVGLVVISLFLVFDDKRQSAILKRVGLVWVMTFGAFLFTLNVQGIMTVISPTDDTYFDGVSRVLNHLSLGVIDIRGGSGDEPMDGSRDDIRGSRGGHDDSRDELGEMVNSEGELKDEQFVLVENSVENLGAGSDVESDTEFDAGSDIDFDASSDVEEAVFDGYVAESTDVRVKLTGAALEVWSSDATTTMRGVGLGGAGQAMYDEGFTSSPKEIVQNEYASLLLETGLVGISLFILTVVLVFRSIWHNTYSVLRMMLVGLIAAYGVSLLFFAGLPNALQVYLLPMVIIML